MRRVWDVFVGSLMVLASVAFQAIFLTFVGGMVGAGIAEYWHIRNEAFVWVFIAAVALLFNGVTFYEFRRGRISTPVNAGRAGMFFLLPRGIARIIHGRETYSTHG